MRERCGKGELRQVLVASTSCTLRLASDAAVRAARAKSVAGCALLPVDPCNCAVKAELGTVYRCAPAPAAARSSVLSVRRTSAGSVYALLFQLCKLT